MSSQRKGYIGQVLESSQAQELPVKLGCTQMCSVTQKLPKRHPFGMFTEASSHRHDWFLPPFPALLSSLKDEVWGREWQASNHGLVPLVTSPHPGAIQESPHQNQRHCCHPGQSKRLRSSVVGTRAEADTNTCMFFRLIFFIVFIIFPPNLSLSFKDLGYGNLESP